MREEEFILVQFYFNRKFFSFDTVMKKNLLLCSYFFWKFFYFLEKLSYFMILRKFFYFMRKFFYFIRKFFQSHVHMKLEFFYYAYISFGNSFISLKILGWQIIPCKIHGIICPTIWLLIFYYAYFFWKFFYFIWKFLGWIVAIQPLWYTESHDSRTGHMSFWLCISCQFFNGFNGRTDHVDS